jgi:hypothetical protein
MWSIYSGERWSDCPAFSTKLEYSDNQLFRPDLESYRNEVIGIISGNVRPEFDGY